MRRAAEFAAFLALAAGLHVSVAAIGSAPEGAQSAGEGGPSAVSLKAASEQLNDLVARWDAPPEVTDQTPPEFAPVPPSPPPDASPAPDITPLAAPVETSKAPGLQLPQTDRAPDYTDRASAPEPARISPDTAKLSKIRPQTRPRQVSPERKPAPAEPAPASDGSAAQRAAGSGGGTNAGSASDSGAATLSAAARQSLMAQWGAQVRRKIERGKRYPSAARGVSGTVRISITVGREGALHAVSVAGSSGHAALDEAALRAVRSAGRFAAAPPQMTEPSYTFTLAMKFNR